MTWRAQAACRSASTALFFARGEPAAPFDITGPVPRRTARLCGGCPVRAECLEYALATRVEDGIWGGMTWRERRTELRRRRRQAREHG